MDILFDTKMDGDLFEDMNHGIVNVLVIISFILILISLQPFLSPQLISH